MAYLLFFTIFISVAFSSIEKGQISTTAQMYATGTVAIIFDREGKGKHDASCTGTRISPQHVLTAKHCVSHFPSNFPVGVRQSLNPLDKSVKLEKVIAIKYPGQKDIFNFGGVAYEGNDDIALLVLEKKSKHPYLRIAHPEKIKGKKLLQLGYGMDSHEEKDVSCYPLSFLNNGVVENLNSIDFNNVREILVKNNKSSVRWGDSGGPLLIRNENGTYELVGILSEADPGPLKEIKNGEGAYNIPYNFVSWMRAAVEDAQFLDEHQVEPKNQYPSEGKEYIAKENVKQFYVKACQSLSEKTTHPWDWSNELNDCFPAGEKSCLEAGKTMSLKWNEKLKRCEWKD